MKGVIIIELTITSKIQIYPTDEQVEILTDTMVQVRKALNYVSKYVFDNNCFNQLLLSQRNLWTKISNGSISNENCNCKVQDK